MKKVSTYIIFAISMAAFCTVTASGSQAQTFTTLVSFGGANGEGPFASLVQGSDGNFYGTTKYGGRIPANPTFGFGCNPGCGTVFKITPSGTLTTLYKFCPQRPAGCPDGANPVAGLVEGADGNFYGTTSTGGNSTGAGTLFKITSGGELTTIYSFCSRPSCKDGALPVAGLVQGSDGNFYGVTELGGAHGEHSSVCAFNVPPDSGCGTVFRITPGGKLTTLYSFCSQSKCVDGYLPVANLVQGVDGNLYGTTAGPYGTVFKISLSGSLTTLYNFCSLPECNDGISPSGSLLQGTDGNFYGTTEQGGNPNGSGGTIFKITPTGVLTTIYEFCALMACRDGSAPTAGLVQGFDGNFYGTTSSGGPNEAGEIFSISATGTFGAIYGFCSQSGCSDGGFPEAGLVQGAGGTFYGVNTLFGSPICFGWDGDADGCGTVFSFDPGLDPIMHESGRRELPKLR